MDILREKLAKSDQFVMYHRADLDTQFDLIMLITEYTPEETLRDYLEQYGFVDEATAGKLWALIYSENHSRNRDRPETS